MYCRFFEQSWNLAQQNGPPHGGNSISGENIGNEEEAFFHDHVVIADSQ